MTNKKKVREIIGYTHGSQGNDAELWYKNSLSFHEASILLHEHKDSLSGGLRLFQYNAALSLELIFKAILAAKGEEIPTTHFLKELCSKAEVILDEDQKFTLDLLTQSIVWLARYPTPKSQEQWDNFHDNIIEKHILRSQSGNTCSTLGNPKRFPSMGNYMNIWGICLWKYMSLLPK